MSLQGANEAIILRYIVKMNLRFLCAINTTNDSKGPLTNDITQELGGRVEGANVERRSFDKFKMLFLKIGTNVFVLVCSF